MKEAFNDLRAGALRLEKYLAGPPIEPAVASWIEAFPEFPRMLVACSGGADSTALLCLLWACFPGNRDALIVAHYNHRWRGEAASGDALFVRDVAEALGLEYVVDERPEGADAFTETGARELRLGFLRALSLERKAPAIAFGHQSDDILETQLQRLARGSGSEGLSAPRPVQVLSGSATHLRPLLHHSGGELRSALKACGIPWREDASNKDTAIARNAIRHTVVPKLAEALEHDPKAGAVRSRRLLEEDALALNALARERIPEAFNDAGQLDRKAFRMLPRALGRRALAAWLAGRGVLSALSAAALDALLDDCYSKAGSGRHSAGKGFVVFNARRIALEAGQRREVKPFPPVRFPVGERVLFGDAGVLECAAVSLDAGLRQRICSGAVDGGTEAYLSLEDSGESFEVRNWRAGDRFHPLGAPGGRKLQDWFTDRRIPVRERKRLPLVCSLDGEVLWVPGFAPAESRKITPRTKQALRLTYQTRNPL